MQGNRKPQLEKIGTKFGSSFSFTHYDESAKNYKPPFWHFHPEIQLVYVKGGNGKRHIGHHLSYYHSGDLVLIGSMLPHTALTDIHTENESETVIQFRNDCFGADFFNLQEMQEVRNLLHRAKAGIAFVGEAKLQIGARIEKMHQLSTFEKMIELLLALQQMAQTEHYKILNADGFAFEVENADNDRINIIYNHVRASFKRPITLEEVSALANMTIPSFCRYFKKVSGKTFTRFVNEYRIVHACKLLTEKHLTISEVSFESGFNNISHFNRLFKEITTKSPLDYRKQYVKMIEDGDIG